jgi:prevent-host-death family protein
MKTVNIQAAKTHLSRLVEEAAAGEDIVIAKAGKPIVKLTPFAAAQTERKLGFLAGQGWETSDCWAEDPEIEALFYGSSVEPLATRVAEEEPS